MTPKTRLIPLSSAFVDYLRADGIVVPPEPSPPGTSREADTYDDDSDEEGSDPSAAWPEVHAAIRETIAALGGRVHPKLNWSAPKDATWIAATNTMECTAPNDVYLLLKSSDFVAHDLDQAFDGCVDDNDDDNDDNDDHDAAPAEGRSTHGPPRNAARDIPYHLVLRKSIPALVSSMEFRCFVRRRRLLGLCPRELKHYDFLPGLVPVLRALVGAFFERELRHSFPDESFVFDVYVPRPRPEGRVWLIDINPWAPRTDPLLFSWLELLEMPDPPEPNVETAREVNGVADGVSSVRIGSGTDERGSLGESESDAENDVEEIGSPEVRIVNRDDPENYSFSTSLYSAHKLPLDVVAAGMDGEGGIRDFLSRWNSHTATAENGVASDDSSD